MATKTEGVTASFLKELLRRAAVIAANSDSHPGESGAAPLTVAPAHLDAALAELNATRNAMTRALLGAGAAGSSPAVDASRGTP